MTHDDFRRIALGLNGAAESAHMGHPDFRAHGRIFATLHADLQWGMVALTPDQQSDFVRAEPRVFVPEKGAWGVQGATAVRLDLAAEESVGEALTLAYRNSAARAAAAKSKRTTRKTSRHAPRRR